MDPSSTPTTPCTLNTHLVHPFTPLAPVRRPGTTPVGQKTQLSPQHPKDSGVNKQVPKPCTIPPSKCTNINPQCTKNVSVSGPPCEAQYTNVITQCTQPVVGPTCASNCEPSVQNSTSSVQNSASSAYKSTPRVLRVPVVQEEDFEINSRKTGTSLYKSNRIYICLSVTKDLANRWTDVILLYRIASHRFWKGI